MNRTALTGLLFALLATAGCSHSAVSTPKTAAPVEVIGKPGAPVHISAELGNGMARVTVRFEAPADAVQITVAGVDGMVVPPREAIVGAYKPAEVKVFDVPFTPAAVGRSNLVVTVLGTFGGAQLASVATFGIGDASAEQRSSTGTVTTTDDGARAKVMLGQ